MNIRSIDLQVLIPRTTEVSKTQQILENQSSLQQQQFAEEWRNIATLRQQQIQHTSQTEEGVIRDRDSGNDHQKKENEKPKRKKNANGSVKDTTGSDPVRGNIIDIKT